MSPAQEQSESSSEPNPLYGGTILGGYDLAFGAALFSMWSNFFKSNLES